MQKFATSTAMLTGTAVLAGCSGSGVDNAAPTAEVDQQRPNIIYIMSDDHAIRALSAYGSDLADLAPTPNIDRIAQNGALFTNSFVTNSLCGPSRAAMFTGKFGHKNGFNFNGQTFDGSQDTWINSLHDAGYNTAAIGKWHINILPDGFKLDHWELLNDQGEYYNPDWITKDGVTMEHGYTTDMITEKTLTWLEEGRDESKPFALIMHHKAPHRNWMPAPRHTRTFENVEFPVPDTYFDNYDGRKAAAAQEMNIYRDAQEGHDLKMTTGVGETEWRQDIWPHLLARLTDEQRQEWDEAYQARNDYMNANEANWSDEEMALWKYQRYMQDYLATIIAVDESVGAVLDYLDENDLTENTILVYTSDQGFYTGEHGWFDKRFMYEESFRTPLLIQYPAKIAAGTVVEEMVQNIDYAPTFLEYAGVELYGDVDGASMVEVIAGESEQWRDALYYHFYEFPAIHQVGRHYGIRDGRYKLMHFYFRTDDWEFYDLEKDPKEMNNAIDDPAYAAEIERLKARLKDLETQYDVPPMEEWRRMNLREHRTPKPKLPELFPQSYGEQGEILNTKS
ncbi:sulfatase family protein [Ferrimonas marina]|uniref:Arylsulfatase A n=1 Tax=Ferrimonas marina TaxID=299255 RepID=A0A1M5YBR8_9GAMM|nr:sulfatase [Ferrimonas marina]SHI09485.1 Arylsulfatase A [Ferrimonas marina]